MFSAVEKKKKGKKKAVFDVDAMLAEATSEAPAAGGEAPASVQEEAASPAPAGLHSDLQAQKFTQSSALMLEKRREMSKEI